MSESFKDRLKRHIEINGPLPLAEFMHWAMADPKQGYYATREPIGSGGDFITAPEVSQMFGELLGIWAINAWQALGKPENFNLLEIGPGRGTLMADLLRAAKSKPDFLGAAAITLVETSDSLTEIQRQTLAGYKIDWHKSVKHIGPAPCIIIANELLDVLPLRQYVKNGDAWSERAINLDERGELVWCLSTGTLEPTSLPAGHEAEPDGAVYEISSIREAFVENIATLLKENGGVALFIDYGHGKAGFGDTFQAVKNHEPVNALQEPGMADLTSHVDFAALENTVVASGMHVYPLTTQGNFLLALGLLERAGALGQNQDKETQETITKEAERLALPDQMGDLFKVFAFSREPLDLAPFSALSHTD